MKKDKQEKVNVACASFVEALRRLRAIEVSAEHAIRAAEMELHYIGENIASGEFNMRDVQRALMEAKRLETGTGA